MTGETQLTVLLRTLAPERQPGDYVYATLPALQAGCIRPCRRSG